MGFLVASCCARRLSVHKGTVNGVLPDGVASAFQVLGLYDC